MFKKKMYLFSILCFIGTIFIIPSNAVFASVVNKNNQEITESYFSNCEEMEAIRSAGTIYESEPNNTSSTADSTNDDYDNYGLISTTSDEDWWVVRFAENGYANFWLSNIPSGCDYDLQLYTNNGTILLKSSMNPGNNDELIAECWVTANTDYFIRIKSYSGSSTSSYYKFRTQNTQYHGYAGFVTATASYKGVYATITTPTSLPNVSDSGESAWVSTSKDSNEKWIQTGANYSSSFTAFKTYTEHFGDGGYIRTWVGMHVLGAGVAYKVEYSSVDTKWHAYISGVDIVSSALATVNNSVQANAEVHKKNIEMGPFTFSNVMVKNSSGTWLNNTATLYANSPYSITGTATNFTVSGP